MKTQNLDIYGNAPIPWTRVQRQIDAADRHRTHWLATASKDGRPHVAGVGAIWSEGKIYVVSGPKTRKSRNMDANPHCVVSVALEDVDLVIEAQAARVSDSAKLERIARLYVLAGWPVEVRDGAFVAPYSAPSAGPAPWGLYELTPRSATGVATADPQGATRWEFAGA